MSLRHFVDSQTNIYITLFMLKLITSIIPPICTNKVHSVSKKLKHYFRNVNGKKNDLLLIK